MATIDNAHVEDIESIIKSLSTDITKGLSDSEALNRRTQYGFNRIEEKKSESPFLILFKQFKSPFLILLFIAAGLSFYFKEWLDGIAIIVVIIINTLIGFIMEYKAERSMEALKKLTKVTAKVFRNGKLKEIPSEDIVQGDILFLEAGDIIPADARIFHLSQLQVDESALTGESVPVEKDERPLSGDITLAERTNMIYKGTFVTRGNGNAIVIATAMSTELGKIAAMVQNADRSMTPLERKIEQLSKSILWLTVILIVVIFISGILKGDNVMLMLQTSIALAVAAIPEGLPIVTTLALAQGMLRMARQNVIVKKLAAVETLGGTTVICTDKTGTLTQNRIEVNTIAFPENGEGADQGNHLQIAEYNVDNYSIKTNKNYQRIIQIVTLCNTAELLVTDGEMKEVGDPLETGLLKYVVASGISIEEYRNKYPKVKEEPFSSETKIMSTVHKEQNSFIITAKGAVEELLNGCSHILINDAIELMHSHDKESLINESDKLATNGLRTIALAFKEVPDMPDNLHQDLVFAGFVGMIDPPRIEVKAALNECRLAGINVVMITGDHPATAKNIGLKIGLLDSEGDEPIHGKEMPDYNLLSQPEKEKWLKTKIFARVSPKQKLDLVSVLQENHHIVGMTGDGVNDAPALKKADIGIAMGQRGSQVAQGVADMVLTDDSFSSIVSAIKQGRIIFDNIRKFVVYLLSCNLSELLIVSFSSFLNLHYALFPLQILYINLVSDVLPALALGVTEGSSLIMRIPPRNINEPIIDRKHWKAVIVYSVVLSVCSLGSVVFSHYTVHKTELWNPELCNNTLFITLILCQLWHVFNMTHDSSISFFKSDVFKNKYIWYAIAICLFLTFGAYFIAPVAKALSLYAPSFNDLLIMLGFSILSAIIIRFLKRVMVIL